MRCEKNHDRHFFKYKNLYCRHTYISSTLSTFCIVWNKKKLRQDERGGGWIIFKKLCTQFFHNCQFIWSFSHTHTSSNFSFPRHIKIQISDANFFSLLLPMLLLWWCLSSKFFSPFVRHKLKLMWYGLNWDAIKAIFLLLLSSTFLPISDLTLQTTKKSH